MNVNNVPSSNPHYFYFFMSTDTENSFLKLEYKKIDNIDCLYIVNDCWPARQDSNL